MTKKPSSLAFFSERAEKKALTIHTAPSRKKGKKGRSARKKKKNNNLEE